ncbi:FkbM family methyltransferase [Novosphingobium malaysiense]|uniref:Methyltransferase FkbM domain-containing protein n=1 Tax=Novosphingobium malaysiense TaxID=1348853 RepID=A0A0B1ZFX6_9SPHN|nr:FkbM family methyltransferase [Novosphingobium malaysiense]KHK89410.1 hypothetical protein LK12_19975 [Novosphingobium malaysiense]
MRERGPAVLTGANRYGQRHFREVPGRSEARALLAELRDSACRAAPQPPRFPITLYGGGDMGRMARDYFASLGHEIGLVVDRNAETLRKDPFWRGVQIAHPDDVPSHVKQDAPLILCVATAPFKPLESELATDGWAEIVPFYDVAESQRDRHPLSNGWFADPLSDTDFARTAEVLEGWDDDLSRAHHLQFLAWRMLREEWTFEGAPVTRSDRFFIPEVSASADALDEFVDGGAHHGQVTRKFAALRDNAFRQIVAIEPDPDNMAAIEAMRAAMAPDVAERIALVSAALGAENDTRPFHRGLGYASQFSTTGQDTLRSETLDSLDLAPDFIKLHLEGAERDALRGAQETIRRHRPILAVTTYHNADGIWRTPAWLMETLEDYRFLMRLHSWCGTGAVVYALPKEQG